MKVGPRDRRGRGRSTASGTGRVPGLPWAGALALSLPLALAAGPGMAAGAGSSAPESRGGPAGGAWATGLTCAVAPHRVELQATGRAPGAAGFMTLRFASSPDGVAVTEEGSYRYRVEVRVSSVPPAARGTLVAWAATPQLDRHVKLGAVGDGGPVRGEVTWNKFLVFVTDEPSPEADRWTGPVLMTGISPSGNMHTMAGHGIFQQHGIGC